MLAPSRTKGTKSGVDSGRRLRKRLNQNLANAFAGTEIADKYLARDLSPARLRREIAISAVRCPFACSTA
jgi:hypothetical protein